MDQFDTKASLLSIQYHEVQVSTSILLSQQIQQACNCKRHTIQTSIWNSKTSILLSSVLFGWCWRNRGFQFVHLACQDLSSYCCDNSQVHACIKLPVQKITGVFLYLVHLTGDPEFATVSTLTNSSSWDLLHVSCKEKCSKVHMALYSSSDPSLRFRQMSSQISSHASFPSPSDQDINDKIFVTKQNFPELCTWLWVTGKTRTRNRKE